MKKLIAGTVAILGIVFYMVSAGVTYLYYSSQDMGLAACIAICLALLASLIAYFTSADRLGRYPATERMLRVVGFVMLFLVMYNVAKSLIYVAVTTRFTTLSVDIFDALLYNGGIDFFTFIHNIPAVLRMDAKDQLLMNAPVLVYAESLFELFTAFAMIDGLVDSERTVSGAFRYAMLEKLGFIPIVLFLMRLIVVASNFKSSAWIEGIALAYPLVFFISFVAELLEHRTIAIINIIPLCMIKDAFINLSGSQYTADGQLALTLIIAVVMSLFWIYWLSSAIDDYCDENKGSRLEKVLSFSFDNLLNLVMYILDTIIAFLVYSTFEMFSANRENDND